MKKNAAVLLLAISVVTVGSMSRVRADGRGGLAKFDGGIGVIPVQNVAGNANQDGTFAAVRRNIVRGVNPGAGPWRIADLRASVDVYGRIRVRGRGLLLASGNGIGTNAGQSVFATLICEAAGPFVERNTDLAGVPLDVNGDFRIDDTLNPAPSSCASPVLLIRTVANGTWFAAGIPSSDDDN